MRGILSHFPRRPPQLKYHLFLFVYFWYLFVISLVSDFLSICPTHELSVYIKSWWCCERQRVSITSATVSNDVFLGRPQTGRCRQGQEPGPAPFPPLRLGGTGARSRGWLGRASTRRTLVKVSGMEMVAVPQPDTDSTMLGNPEAVPRGVLRRDARTCCCAGFLLRQSTAFPWTASPIYSHVPRWASHSHWALRRWGQVVRWKWCLEAFIKRQINLAAFLPHLQPRRQQWVDELYRDRSLTWNLGVLFCLHSGLLLSAPFKKKIFSASMVLSQWFIFWKCGWSPIKMWAKSLQKEHNVKSR